MPVKKLPDSTWPPGGQKTPGERSLEAEEVAYPLNDGGAVHAAIGAVARLAELALQRFDLLLSLGKNMRHPFGDRGARG